jgi:hypothetical protein
MFLNHQNLHFHFNQYIAQVIFMLNLIMLIIILKALFYYNDIMILNRPVFHYLLL